MSFLKSLFKNKSQKTNLSHAPNLTPDTKASDDYQELGFQRKRNGDFPGSKQAYYKAIQLNPYDPMAYYGLAKTCYVANDRLEAIVNYVSAMHLRVAIIINEIHSQSDTMYKYQRTILEANLNNSPGVLEDIRKRHPDADAIFYDHNTPMHLAHALIDFSPQFSKSPKIAEHIDIYRKGMMGMKLDFDINIDDQIYLPVGQMFSLDNLLWKQIKDTTPNFLYTSSSNFKYEPSHNTAVHRLQSFTTQS
jgi:hypothetical protein